MSKINIRKVKNVECYDFETKTNIPYGEAIEVKETKFIKQKLEEKILEEVLEEIKAKKGTKKEPPKKDQEESDDPEDAVEGGVKDDSGECRESKEEI